VINFHYKTLTSVVRPLTCSHIEPLLLRTLNGPYTHNIIDGLILMISRTNILNCLLFIFYLVITKCLNNYVSSLIFINILTGPSMPPIYPLLLTFVKIDNIIDNTILYRVDSPLSIRTCGRVEAGVHWQPTHFGLATLRRDELDTECFGGLSRRRVKVNIGHRARVADHTTGLKLGELHI